MENMQNDVREQRVNSFTRRCTVMPIIQTERGKTGGTSSKSIINTLVSSLGTYQSQGPPKSWLTGEV